MNEQDKKAAAYLAAQGVTYSAVLIGPRKRDGWDCDAWRISFSRGAAALDQDYFTGTGHRKSARPMPADIARLRPNILARHDWEKANLTPVAPTAGSVLYSLLMDASGAEENFHDWCANYGYDTDSRKALATYEACCSIRADVNKFFTAAERAELAAILEDY